MKIGYGTKSKYHFFDKDQYAHLISYTRGVRYIVGRNNPIIVYDEIINAIKENVEDGNTVAIKPQRFVRGEKVIITDGPFKDFYGIFEREIKGHERVMILTHYTLLQTRTR